MKISLGTRVSDLDRLKGTNGYGYATKCMYESLQRLGYHIEPNDSSADVEIWFDQPPTWKFSPNTYKIGYHPWESTELQPGWAEIMNKCDEIWTPSPLIADWYRQYAGVTVPVYVYQHGIDPIWKTVKREPSEKIKFLHIGAEATRKGGWDTVRAFRRAFPHNQDVSLTIKMINSGWNGIPNLGRVRYINGPLSLGNLQKLYYLHDVYVYPSAGEGFGLTPMQAIATGMPTITVPDWAPYADYLDPNLSISAKLVRSPWPKIHPGKVFRPKFDDVIDRMRWVVDNYEPSRDYAIEKGLLLHENYDWDSITKEVFVDLEKRLIDKNIL